MSNITTDFITATKKIHADVRAILTSLHMIREDVKLIREQVVRDTDKPSSHTQAQQPNQQPNEMISHDGSHTLNADNSLRKKESAQKETDSPFQRFIKTWWKAIKKPTLQIEIAALCGLAFYTCETTRTNNLTQIAIGDARENFIKDHAPYVWVTPQPPALNLNERFRWDVQYANYGRSPALELHSCAKAAYGKLGLSALATIKLPNINGAECHPTWRSTMVLPPSPASVGYITAVAEEPLSQSDIDTIKSTDGGALVLGIVEYSDAVGHTYNTVFCSYRLEAGALMHCEKYNYIRETK